MIRLGLEPVPDSFNSEQAEYLSRVISQLIDSINSVHDMDADSKYPVNQVDGMFRYSVGDGDFQEGAGFYGRVDGEWGPLGSGAEVFNEYGGLNFNYTTEALGGVNSIYLTSAYGFKSWFGKTDDNQYRVLGFAYNADSQIGIQPIFNQIKLNKASYVRGDDGTIAYGVLNNEPKLVFIANGKNYTIDITEI